METKTIATALALLLTGSLTVSAAWNTNLKENLQLNVRDNSTEPASVLAHQAPNGNMFVSWIERTEGSEYLRLQLIDKDGNELFEKGGMYVSEQPTNSFGMGYDMQVDPDGNCIVAFSDCRFEPDERNSFYTFAYKIDQQGEMVWGEDGVDLLDSEFSASPSIGITADGSILIGLDTSYEIVTDEGSIFKGGYVLVRLDGDGNKVWDAPKDFPAGYVSFTPCGDSDLYVCYKRGHLYLDRINADAESVWDEPALIDDRQLDDYAGGVMTPDGLDGVFITYMREVVTGIYYSCLQHVDADGILLMGMTGMDLMESDAEHSTASLACNAERQEVFAYWNCSMLNDSYLMMKRMNYYGDPLWDDEFKKMKSSTLFGFTTAPGHMLDDGSVIMVYADNMENMTQKFMTMRITGDDRTAWRTEIGDRTSVIMSTPQIIYDEEEFFIYWIDNRAIEDKSLFLSGDVYAQGLSYGGGVSGVEPIVSAIGGDAVVTVIGDAATIAVSGKADVTLYNATGAKVAQRSAVEDETHIEGLSKGIYIVEIATAQGRSTAKFAVR